MWLRVALVLILRLRHTHGFWSSDRCQAISEGCVELSEIRAVRNEAV